jgi:hypothetical protein
MMRRTSAGDLGGTPFCRTASWSRYWSGAIGAIEIAWLGLGLGLGLRLRLGLGLT